jgi:hypothetical protein
MNVLKKNLLRNKHSSDSALIWKLQVFGLLLCTLLIFFLPSLDYPFSMDSIHLIRPYSVPDLLGTWSGQWDPDNIETAGWRPFTTSFYCVEWLLFRSSALIQRIALIFFMALTFTMLCDLFQQFTDDRTLALAASLLTATSMSSYYHATFLADGIHIFLLFLLLIATRFFLQIIRSPSVFNVIGFLVFYIIALLTREEAVSWAIALPLISLLAIKKFTFVHWRHLWRIMIVLGIVIAIYFLLRMVFLYDINYQSGVLLHPVGCNDAYPHFINGIKSVFMPFDIFGKNITHIVIGVLFFFAFVFSSVRFKRCLFIMIGIVLCMLIHTQVYYRSNLLCNAVPFVALIIAFTIWKIIPWVMARWVIIIFICTLGTLSAYQREITFHPQSVSALEWDLDVQELLGERAHAVPCIAADLESRLRRFNLIKPNGDIDRENMKRTIIEANKRPRILWPWDIPKSVPFAPAKHTWW